MIDQDGATRESQRSDSALQVVFEHQRRDFPRRQCETAQARTARQKNLDTSLVARRIGHHEAAIGCQAERARMQQLSGFGANLHEHADRVVRCLDGRYRVHPTVEDQVLAVGRPRARGYFREASSDVRRKPADRFESFDRSRTRRLGQNRVRE